MATTVKERPILFSAPMVRAILEGRKTQTRRIWKMPKGCEWYGPGNGGLGGEAGGDFAQTNGPGWWHVSELCCPYGDVGDRLWVRESWNVFQFSQDGDENWPLDQISKEDPREECERFHIEVDYAAKGGDGPWRPSIHMPRWASRITLEITEIRVERLNAISEEDAKAEGVEGQHFQTLNPWVGYLVYREPFAQLWEKINGKGSWESNPWVWVISFKRVEA